VMASSTSEGGGVTPSPAPSPIPIASVQSSEEFIEFAKILFPSNKDPQDVKFGMNDEYARTVNYVVNNEK
jgi:hypothetical protein